MPVGPGGYPTAYRRGAPGFQASPSGSAQAPSGNLTREISKGYARGLSTAQSLGELAPYQSGTPTTQTAPRTTPSAPLAGGNLTKYMSGGYHSPASSPSTSPLTFTPPSAASMARTAALIAARMLGRGGPALPAHLAMEAAKFAFENWDQIKDFFGGGGASGEWYSNPPTFTKNHPFSGAQELLNCETANPPAQGPSFFDGDCAITGDVSITDWENVPSWVVDGLGRAVWRYHSELGLTQAGRMQFRLSSRYRSVVAGETPLAPTVTPQQTGVMPNPLAQPAVQTAGPGVPPPPLPPRQVVYRHERAKGLAQRGFALASFYYGTADEIRELVDAMHDALDGPCKRKGLKGILAKAADIARCAGTMNLNRLAWNLVRNEIEDAIIGRSIGAAGRATRWVRGGIGSGITGPAL